MLLCYSARWWRGLEMNRIFYRCVQLHFVIVTYYILNLFIHAIFFARSTGHPFPFPVPYPRRFQLESFRHHSCHRPSC
jgi:hypothetical protein